MRSMFTTVLPSQETAGDASEAVITSMVAVMVPAAAALDHGELMKGLLLRLGWYGADAGAPSVHCPQSGTPILTLPIFYAPAHDHARPVLEVAERHP